jgi:hypothetical protein
MGWFDNLWRRSQRSATGDKEKMVETHEGQAGEPEGELADELEKEAHAYRDEQLVREPRIPPGTG